MIIKAERCWGGGENFSFRLTMPCGARESVKGEEWTRAVAREALNIAEYVYGLKRRNVKFDVR